MPRVCINTPVYPQTDETHIGNGRGLMLRDYLAAAALQGLLASASDIGATDGAQAAYRYADAMLAARLMEE